MGEGTETNATTNSTASPPAQPVRRSAGQERLKQRIQAFVTAVKNRDVAGMNEFRTYMRMASRQMSFEQVWSDDEALESMGIEFKDPMAKYLYMQMYFQHYFESNPAESVSCVWALTNMSDLFNELNRSSFVADIQASWLWSIIDEFVSVFEAVRRFKSLDQLKGIPQISQPLLLLNPLHQLVETSKVIEMIEAKRAGKEIESGPAFYRALGYYSVVGLIRFYTFDGDYAQALNFIDRISVDFQDQQVYSGMVLPCILATNYYAAFCCMMARRYMDSVKVLTDALQYVFETKDVEQKLLRSRSIPYYVRKMCNTLALVLTLYPIQVSDNIFNEMKSVVGNRFNRLLEGDLSAFSEVFIDAAPSCPYSCGDDPSQRMKTKEYKAFMIEAEEQRPFIKLRSILEHFSSISIEKLAGFIRKSESETLSYLMSWKHKLALPCGKASMNEMIRSQSTIDFFIDMDMVYVSHIKPADKFSSMFLEQYISLRKLQSERSKRLRV